MLHRVLESSGLAEGREYELQVSGISQDKRRYADAVIHLPRNRKMVIDSKVSLVQYEQFVNADDEDTAEMALNSHLSGVKRHIQELGSKRYDLIYDEHGPDFTLMFVPIESAFSVALQHTPDLYNYALSNNVIMVTPTTLLATLRTIDLAWQNDRQQNNAREIAERAGALYDKFVGLTEDFAVLGRQLKTVGNSYEEVEKKLTGRGNLSRQVEMLKTLGAKSSKQIDVSYLGEEEY
jgi:DNA recombination protein RmuC